MNNNSNNEQVLEENSKTWYSVWKLIDDFDAKRVENDYPYQQREIEMIIKNTTKAMNKTTFMPKKLELNFVQIENLVNDIRRRSESLYHNNDKKNAMFLEINTLKDEIHRLYTKYREDLLSDTREQSKLINGVVGK